jgi:hypothetical protein
MKPIIFQNILNKEKVFCENPKQMKQYIDGVEYLVVHRGNKERSFLMRKDSLVKINYENRHSNSLHH